MTLQRTEVDDIRHSLPIFIKIFIATVIKILIYINTIGINS